MYKGKIQFFQSPDEIRLSIPADRNWFPVIAFTLFIPIWAFAEYLFFAGKIFENLQSLFPFLFWFLGWSIAGCLAIRMWLWHVAGKTIIAKGDDYLTIKKKRLLFSRIRRYELFEIAEIFIQNRDIEKTQFITRKNYLVSDVNQTIAIRYKNSIVRVVDWLTKADAEFIITKLD